MAAAPPESSFGDKTATNTQPKGTATKTPLEGATSTLALSSTYFFHKGDDNLLLRVLLKRLTMAIEAQIVHHVHDSQPRQMEKLGCIKQWVNNKLNFPS